MILIVDDDRQFGPSFERFLRYGGLEALHINNPMEVLSLLQVRNPRLIVLDLNMPQLDGLALLKAIRKDPAYNAVPILVHSSEIDATAERDVLAAGATGFLVKGTIGWDGLLQRIKKLLGDDIPPLRLAQ